MLPFHPWSQCRLVEVIGKKLDITNSPQVLVVHISRFGSGLHKIDAYVKFPIELTTEHIKSGNGHLLTYRLRGLIIHKGQSIAEGHFMAFVLIEGNWYKADDRKMSRVSWQRVSSLKAYILVYHSL